ncbi:MAG: hypothetical protein HW403_466 [Dehalococcoidia bacterium]|nr:hypothetical protein [Dehalococcoidia bacterium]
MPNFFSDGMPLPAPDQDTAGFWEGCKRHTLLVQRCAKCGVFRMPPVPVCYDCHSSEYEWVESIGVGEVYTSVIVHHPPHPATRDRVPYNVVVVQLDDCGQVKLVSNLVDCANEDIQVGMKVQVAWEDTTPDVAQPRFRPLVEASSGPSS